MTLYSGEKVNTVIDAHPYAQGNDRKGRNFQPDIQELHKSVSQNRDQGQGQNDAKGPFPGAESEQAKNRESVRVHKKGDPEPGTEFVTVGGKRRAVKSDESFVSLVRGALRSLSPGIKDRRERIDDAIEEANKGNRKK